jgi:hypothetical protein
MAIALQLTEPIELFIINFAMLGFGTTLALYALIIPQMEKIFERQADKLKTATKDLKKLNKQYGTKLLKSEEDEDLKEEREDVKLDVIELKKIKFHHGTGFLITGISFILAMIFPLLEYMSNNAQGDFIILFTNISPIFLLFGTGVLIFVWIKVYLDIKEMLKKYLEKAIEESEKELEASNK